MARTTAKQFSKKAEAATAPFQYALSTKAGCECVAHILQALSDRDPEGTIMSIDGIGAFDLISRNAMLEGLLRMEDGDQILPFVRCFYGSQSTYLWEDEMGVTKHISHGEGGEQGDPLKPMLFALGQHSSLVAVQGRLRDNEHVLAYHDDVCKPARVADVHPGPRAHPVAPREDATVEQSLLEPGIGALTRAVRAVKPDALVWRGDPLLPVHKQGSKVLGISIGQPAFRPFPDYPVGK